MEDFVPGGVERAGRANLFRSSRAESTAQILFNSAYFQVLVVLLLVCAHAFLFVYVVDLVFQAYGAGADRRLNIPGEVCLQFVR